MTSLMLIFVSRSD